MRLIDADELKAQIRPIDENDEKYAVTGTTLKTFMLNLIDKAPAVYGKWIPVSGVYGKYYCSVCDGIDTDCSDYYGSHSVLDQEYCPWCGAKMCLEKIES